MPYEIFSADQTDSIGASALLDAKWWTGLAKPAGNGGKSRNYRDGDFSQATPIEAPRIEYPLQEQGDKSTFIIRQKVVQSIDRIKALPPYSVHPQKKDAYLIEEGPLDDKGSGVGIWERVYCTVPKTRWEYEKFPYAYQYIASQTALGTIVRSVLSQVKYEYFLARDRAAFLPFQKLEMDTTQVGSQTLFYKSGVGDLHVAVPSFFFVSNDPLIVAEDSDVKVWKHPIMYRATRYVPGPTLEFLGANTTFPLPA